MIVGNSTVSSLIFIKELCIVNIGFGGGKKNKTYAITTFFSCYIISKWCCWVSSGILGNICQIFPSLNQPTGLEAHQKCFLAWTWLRVQPVQVTMLILR